ncbi:hypothetical protein Pst134EB_020009 [Puccinia striiformis f. sp. tritici]|nr:hypothetical protein Pst134EB_020009 [Puccinia striiformis f. sp. tritici]
MDHQQSSEFASTNSHNNNTSHSPLHYLNSPSDLSSDPPNWRSGFGNGRFTVDSGGGPIPLDAAPGPTGSNPSSGRSSSTKLTGNNRASRPEHSTPGYQAQQQSRTLSQSSPSSVPQQKIISRPSEFSQSILNNIPTSPQSIHEQDSPAVISTGSSSLTNQIPIPTPPASSSVYHQDQPSSLSHLVGQIHDGIGPSSLPTHFGDWSSHLDTHHFGSVPSSPVHPLENGYPVDTFLANSSVDHHPSHPFTTIGSAASSSRRNHTLFLGSSDSHTQSTPFLSKPILQNYPTNQKTESQFSLQSQQQQQQQQQQHISTINHGIRNPSSDSHQGFRPPTNCASSTMFSISSLAGKGVTPSFSASRSATDPSVGPPTAGVDSYLSTSHRSTHPEATIRQSVVPPQANPRWPSNPTMLSPTDNSSQPIRQLAEDAIYVSTGPASHSNDRASSEWANHPSTSDRSFWHLREPSTVLESPQSATYSPFSPASPYSSWSSLAAADEGSMYDYRSPANVRSRDPFAAQLWQLYGPRDEKAPTNDALESLIRRLTELGLDVNQIRQRLNSHEWKDNLVSKEVNSSGWSPDTSGSTTRTSGEFVNNNTSNESSESSHQGSSDKASRTSMRNTPQPSRLSKINENGEGLDAKLDSLKSPLFGREPSLERGRKIEGGRRVTCNLAGRWQEECTNTNRSPAVSDMDWKAASRSRSRTQGDWRQGSRSRSRLQDLRPDLLTVGHLFDGDSSPSGMSQRLKPSLSTSGLFEPPPSSLFPELNNQIPIVGSSAAGDITGHDAYHDGLIQQLIGSYHAQQSEENGLQSLAEKHTDHLSFEPSELSASSSGLFQPSSATPLGEFDFGSWHLPIKPSQHSLLGSIPGLTQDYADLANAHSEYGYIPRLVRKTSFDEILAQQHHPKRPTDSGDRSPARLDNLSCSTTESLVRPNTATDPREGQYRMGLDPSGCEKAQTLNGSAHHSEYIDVFSSTLSQSDSTEAEFRSQFQSSRLSSNSNSSDDLAFQDNETTLQPFFDTNCGSIVDRITPYTILTQLDPFDSTPIANNPRSQWLQGSVAPTAVQPTNKVESANKKTTEVIRLVSSPSSASSSSEASSRGGLALRINTANAQSQMEKELSAGEVATKISFSGGRSNHTSSIGEARRRTKQLPYSSAEPASANNPATSSNGQANPSTTQCLNCHTKETPLWRRDSEGRPLCNACGLFVNLHGTPRPAALSTGIIKRRNRGKNRERNPGNSASSNRPATSSLTPVTRNLNPTVPHSLQYSNNLSDQSAPSRSSTHHHYPSPSTSL